MKTLFARCLTRIKSLRGDEEGFVVMATLGIFLMLFVLCASIYAVGETARQKIRIQNACDAAAYSAAVVQADGLSRMASINRAMAQTYVHMTNLQMDYITYRWMRLTAQRFYQDYENAKEYHKWIVTSFDPKLGWWAILEVAVDAYTSRLFGAKCNYRHDKEGPGWWCGRGPNKNHHIMFNGNRYGTENTSYENLVKDIDQMSALMDDVGSISGSLTDKDEDEADSDSTFENELKAERDEINAKYDRQIAALDVNDPDYESKRAALENLRDSELDALARSYEDGSHRTMKDGVEDQYDKTEQERLAQDLRGVGDANSTVVSPAVNTSWGSRFAKLIDADKKNIQLLNASLSVVNANMYESMQSTAKFVLTSMLRDPRLPPDRALKNASAYFYIPRGINPYQVSDTEREENFFSPLYNTEPCERIFLHMAKSDGGDGPLYRMFPTENGAGGTKTGWGLDQWFVRAGRNENGNVPTVVRTEGSLGIQRAYKDANINETGAGLVLLKRFASRGNHIANLHLEDTPDANQENEIATADRGADQDWTGDMEPVWGWVKKGHGHLKRSTREWRIIGTRKKMQDNLLKKMAGKLFDNLVGRIADQYCDITASAGNASSEKLFQMCQKSSDTVALYADYDWSSAKWICLNRATFATMWLDYLLCKLFTGKCDDRIFFCNYGSCKHKKKRLFITFSYTHRGWGHYHIPKWFCGMKPKFQGNVALGISESVAKWTLVDLLPPLLPEQICDSIHGYMGNSARWDDFIVPSKPLFGGGRCSIGTSVSPYHGTDCVLDRLRNDYCSCACFFDGLATSWNYKGFWSLNADGYADEEENTNFSEDERNSVKPVSGLINGHARIYGDDQEIFDDRYIGEQCQPWVLNEKFFSGLGTIVVGAAVKHENPFVQLFNFWGSDDKDMGNTVLSAFDPPTLKGMSFGGRGIPGGNCIWAMSAARAGVRRNRRAGTMDGERMYQVTYDGACDAHRLAIKNEHYYKKNAGWSAGQMPDEDDPKIVAGCVCDGNAEKFRIEWNLCEQDWDATLLPLRYAGQGAEGVGSENCTWKAAADVSGGKAATDIGNKNPLNPSDPSASWRPLDGSSDPPRLDSLLPDGASRLRLEAILKQNKIL